MSAPTEGSGHDEIQLLIGAHVLGGLDADDRAALEEHLVTCVACRDDLARMAPLPGLLRRMPTQSSAPQLPGASLPPVPLESLLARVRTERARGRRRARGLVAAVAVAGLAAAVGSGVLTGDDPAPVAAPPAVTATSPLRPASGVTTAGDAALTEKAWGTAITATVENLTGNGPYALVVVGLGETPPEQAAVWAATPSGSATVSGASSLQPGQIGDVRVVDGDGRLLASTAPG